MVAHDEGVRIWTVWSYKGCVIMLDEWVCVDYYVLSKVVGEFDYFFFQAEDGIRDGTVTGVQTCALPIFELLAEAPDLDLLLVPVGGGGLIAGCSTAAKALRPDIRVVGVEPEAGDDTRRSLAAGERVRIETPRTIADGQQADIPGRLTFEVNRQRVDAVELVADAEILAGMAFLFDRMKLVAEPSGASAVSALLAGRVEAAGARVGVVISGGNVGVARFCELMGRPAAWAPPGATRGRRRPNGSGPARRSRRPACAGCSAGPPSTSGRCGGGATSACSSSARPCRSSG